MTRLFAYSWIRTSFSSIDRTWVQPENSCAIKFRNRSRTPTLSKWQNERKSWPMTFDFSKPAPQLQSLDEGQQLIDERWICAGQSQTKQQTLTSKNTDLKEKLKTCFSNASLPPFSD